MNRKISILVAVGVISFGILSFSNIAEAKEKNETINVFNGITIESTVKIANKFFSSKDISRLKGHTLRFVVHRYPNAYIETVTNSLSSSSLKKAEDKLINEEYNVDSRFIKDSTLKELFLNTAGLYSPNITLKFIKEAKISSSDTIKEIILKVQSIKKKSIGINKYVLHNKDRIEEIKSAIDHETSLLLLLNANNKK